MIMLNNGWSFVLRCGAVFLCVMFEMMTLATRCHLSIRLIEHCSTVEWSRSTVESHLTI